MELLKTIEKQGKTYKVFFDNTEVAEFDTMQEVLDYIDSQIKNDENLDKTMFECYFKM